MRRRVPLLFMLLLALGIVRFLWSGLIPAARTLSGDFAAAFPSPLVARLRPDFQTTAVLGANEGLWNYGPIFHLVTLPLALVPRWQWVPAAWATVNLAALALTFFLVLRFVPRQPAVWPAALMLTAALWLLFQPLINCFVQGNIEIVEMAVVMTGLAWVASRRATRGGATLAMASGIKLLPIGFVGWLLLSRRWRALAAAGLTLAIVWLLTAVTLDWNRSLTRRSSLPIIGDSPVAGFHEVSLTTLFMHRSSVLDRTTPTPRWFPIERRHAAARAGAIASGLLALTFAGVLFWASSRAPHRVTPEEIAILFLLMLVLPPWNHDYYYVFALIPLTLVAFSAMHARDRWTMAAVLVAYALMSPPVPFGTLDRLTQLELPFAYWFNFLDVPLAGALLLLWAATRRLLIAVPLSPQRAPA